MFLGYQGSRQGSRIRCLVVWSAATAALALVASVAGDPAAAAWHDARALPEVGVPLDVALAGLASVVLLGCAGWLWLLATLVTLEAARGVSVPDRRRPGVPAAVRRVVLAACGVALTGVVAQPSFAAQTTHHPHHRLDRGTLDGLPLPDRAVAPPRTGGTPPPERRVLVSAGDSLWSIAESDLPADATDARIAARWHALYAANRALVGPDPDLIVPGQRLLLPGKDPT